MPTVCVYCASSSKVKPAYFRATEELGKAMVKADWDVVYGAGSIGLMGKLADTVLDAGGKITGVIPRFMCEAGWGHNFLTKQIIVETMHERKEKMASMADAVVALPGGCGTLEELLEIITWKQLGLFLKPIIIVNIDGYFDHLLSMLEQAVGENFMRDIHLKMWSVVTSVESIIPTIENTPDWDENIGKLAAI